MTFFILCFYLAIEYSCFRTICIAFKQIECGFIFHLFCNAPSFKEHYHISIHHSWMVLHVILVKYTRKTNNFRSFWMFSKKIKAKCFQAETPISGNNFVFSFQYFLISMLLWWLKMKKINKQMLSNSIMRTEIAVSYFFIRWFFFVLFFPLLSVIKTVGCSNRWRFFD